MTETQERYYDLEEELEDNTEGLTTKQMIEFIEKSEGKYDYLLELVKIADKKFYGTKYGEKWTKSPYSDSFYLTEENDMIDWGSKPEYSFRISNHWNFETIYKEEYTQHCKLDKEEYNDTLILAEFKNNIYNFVQTT